MFDDQTGLSNPARAVIYSIDFSADTATVTWEYRGTVLSFDMGSFRVLDDGSRVIGWGMSANSSLGFTEVDVNGNDLLDLEFPAYNTTYRAIKIPTTAFDINLLRATAGTD